MGVLIRRALLIADKGSIFCWGPQNSARSRASALVRMAPRLTGKTTGVSFTEMVGSCAWVAASRCWSETVITNLRPPNVEASPPRLERV